MARVRIIRAGATSSASPMIPSDQASRQTSPFSEPEKTAKAALRRVLNTGSGERRKRALHPVFHTQGWDEIRLDIDPSVSPNIIGSVVDMKGLVPDASVDAIWSSHNIEHLYEHEVGQAFREFRRVLKPTGFMFLTCPDIEEIARLVVEKGLDAPAYVSPAGPIRAIDMIFGHSPSITAGNTYMAHKTGLTVDLLGSAILNAGFGEVRVSKGAAWDLWAIGFMPNCDIGFVETLLRTTSEAYLFEREK